MSDLIIDPKQQQKPTPVRLAAEFSDVVQKAFHASLRKVIEDPNLVPYVQSHLDKLLEVAAYNLLTLTRKQDRDKEMLRRFCIKAGEAFAKMSAFLDAQERKKEKPA